MKYTFTLFQPLISHANHKIMEKDIIYSIDNNITVALPNKF